MDIHILLKIMKIYSIILQIVICLHFIKKFFHYENRRIILSFFRVFILSCFIYLFGSGLSGLGDRNGKKGYYEKRKGIRTDH